MILGVPANVAQLDEARSAKLVEALKREFLERARPLAFIDVTYEKGGTLVRTTARVSAGWDESKSYCQFYGDQCIDFRSDITLRVKVWMSGFRSGNSGVLIRADGLKCFPAAFAATYENQSIVATIAGESLTLRVPLHESLPWINTSNGKVAIDWRPGIVASHDGMAYEIRHMIVINFPNPKRGDFKEWDLLPFLPGGLVERNRRKH